MKSLYQRFVERYYQFRKQMGIPVLEFTGRDGSALKKVMKYLLALTDNHEESAERGWDFILSNWGHLRPFLQRQFQLYHMTTYLPEMIDNLNPHGTIGRTETESAGQGRENTRRRALESLARRNQQSPQGGGHPQTGEDQKGND